jgi:hypothetical protein
MTGPLDVYIFREAGFAPAGDTVVCIARRAAVKPFMSKDEIDATFSGHVSYHRPLWKLYIGVWGRRNGSRFRRLLRERGAEVILHHEVPPLLTRTSSVTHKERARVRTLGKRQT